MTRLALLLLLASTAAAADWPGFLGPHGTGVADEPIARAWPAPPKEVWRKEAGVSWAAPAIAHGKLVYVHREGESEVADCLDAATGKSLWTASEPTPYEDAYGAGSGPRATPLIAGDVVYTLGVTARLTARELATGKTLWSRDLTSDFHPEPRDLFFGIGMSPIICDDALLLGIGGASAGIVGLAPATGKTLWTATSDGPSYSTPLALPGKLAVFLTRAGVVALEPASGAVRWALPFRSRQMASVNAATPVLVAPGQVFVTSAYDTGGLLLALDGAKPREVWHTDAMGCHFATPIASGGFLYGFDGRYDSADSRLACVDLATGKLAWAAPEVTKGNLIRAGDRWLIWAEGRLTLADLTPKGFTALASADLLPGPTWTPPALADGRLYVKNERTLICLALPSI